MHIACQKGHVTIAKLLLESRANLMAGDEEGRTRLHWAAWNGYADIVQLLLNRDADIAAQRSLGGTPLRGAYLLMDTLMLSRYF
jgi:ankyrin repeat protein